MIYKALEAEDAERIKQIDAERFVKNAWRMNKSTGERELT